MLRFFNEPGLRQCYIDGHPCCSQQAVYAMQDGCFYYVCACCPDCSHRYLDWQNAARWNFNFSIFTTFYRVVPKLSNAEKERGPHNSVYAPIHNFSARWRDRQQGCSQTIAAPVEMHLYARNCCRNGFRHAQLHMQGRHRQPSISNTIPAHILDISSYRYFSIFGFLFTWC